MGARVEPPCSLGEPPVPTQADSASVCAAHGTKPIRDSERVLRLKRRADAACVASITWGGAPAPASCDRAPSSPQAWRHEGSLITPLSSATRTAIFTNVRLIVSKVAQPREHFGAARLKFVQQPVDVYVQEAGLPATASRRGPCPAAPCLRSGSLSGPEYFS